MDRYSDIVIKDPSPKAGYSIWDKDAKTMEQQEIERFGQDTKHRKLLIIWTMIIISIWLCAVLCLVALCKHLSDVVLTTLLATTTINVLGLAKIILGNLFPRSSSKK